MSNLKLLLLPAALLFAACGDPPTDDPAGGSTGGTSNNSGGSGNTGNNTGATGNGGGNTGGSGGGSDFPVLTGPPFGHPNPSTTYPEYEGFTLWLVEEFDQPLDLDNDPIWTWSDGGLEEGDVRFQKEGISFGDGKMRLTVDVPDDSSANPQSCSHAEYDAVYSKPLISGEMRTRHNMFRYGRYEVRLKAPSVKPGNTEIDGNYIATMFVFRTPKFIHWREIDIEVIGDNRLATNLITGDNYFKWHASIQEVDTFNVEGNTRAEFHDYAFEWVPDRITWYYDGEVVRERKADDGGLPIPEKSAKIMMNLWIFNDNASFGGTDKPENEYPMTTEYEWFRFYKWDGEDTYPCDGMNPSCLSADDKVLSSNNPCDGIPHVGQINGKDACQATCN